MHILHIYKDYHPVIGGIENHIKVLAENQVRNGHAVTVLACSQSGKTETEVVNDVHIIRTGRLTTVASMPISLSAPLKMTNIYPDIVHIHSPYPLGEFGNLFFGRGRAVVITHHSDVIRQKNLLRLYGPFLKLALRKADRIIATSPHYIKTSPWLAPHAEKCRVVPLGVDHMRFLPGEYEAREKNLLLFVGRHRYYKDLPTLLRAVDGLPGVRLKVVGDGPMRKDWEAERDRLGLTDRVEFTGELTQFELIRAYQTASLFVLPSNSRAEAFGSVLLEAMSCGLPCITTELGTGTNFVVQDGITGLTVKPNDAPAMARAIQALLADPVRLRLPGMAGREQVSAKFKEQDMIRGVMDVYIEALWKES